MLAFDPGFVLELIERERGTALLGVPTMQIAMLEHPDLLNQQLDAMIERAAKREQEHIPADLVPRVRRVVTDVDKRRRIERGLERIDRAKDKPAARGRPLRERRREAS